MAKKEMWWGRSASLDLHDCDPKLIKSPPAMRKFVRELCKVINMKRKGPTEIKRFGHGDLRGYSMMQFIETSSIVAHFDEVRNRAFIDVFSCKTFNPKTAANFAKKFFKAKSITTYVEERK